MIRHLVGPLLLIQACATAPARPAAIDPSNPDAPESAPLEPAAAPGEPAAAELAGGDASPAAQYTCPMHPEVVSDQPGNCPKCGMKLVPKGKQPSPTDHSAHGH
jgi:hypothetical protein